MDSGLTFNSGAKKMFEHQEHLSSRTNKYFEKMSILAHPSLENATVPEVAKDSHTLFFSIVVSLLLVFDTWVSTTIIN